LKKINRIRLYSFVIIGLFIILTNSCKKDDNNNIPSTVKDIDGNIYHTVTIGTQVWLAENIKTTHYCNGDSIPNGPTGTSWYNQKTGSQCDYGNKPSNGLIYGKLYNWYAVDDSRKLCPTGWHVATNDEWTSLSNYLGGDSIAGGKLKENGVTHWAEPNVGANNLSGFTALPGGGRTGEFAVLGYLGIYWTSTEGDTVCSCAWRRALHSDDSILISNGLQGKSWGMSVRCIKDN